MTDQPDANGVLQAVYDRANSALRVSGVGVSADAALPAGPTGWTLVPAAPDYESGGTARLMEIPLSDDGGFVTVYQCRFAGDAFPRLIIVSDGSFFISDGTFNPLSAGGNYNFCGLNPDGTGGLLLASPGAKLHLSKAGVLTFDSSLAMSFNGSTAVSMSSGTSLTLSPGTGPLVVNAAISSSPTDSHTATTAFGALAVGTPLQNVLGYDILVSGTVNVTAATAGSVKLGVGASATPTTDPITGSITTAALAVIAFSAVVPNNYYLSLQSAGTITLASPVIVATPL